jgi:hemoglobin
MEGNRFMTKSIYEQIGGAKAVDAAVDIFYRKVLADLTISHFFDAIDITKQRAKQKAFLTMVFGGPNKYDGKDLRAAHAPLVTQGLTDKHFDAVAKHLKATLEQLKVPADLTNQILAIAGSVRNDVLGR